MITILTVSFNQAKFLPNCIASVANQTYRDYEHIVIDAGSTDGSRQLLETLKTDRMSLIFEPDHGPSDGLNKGLARMKGDIMIYLNSDDELSPNALAQIDALHRTYSEQVIVGNGWIIDETSGPKKFVQSDKFSPIRSLLGVGVVLQQATSFKSELFQTGVKFNADNKVCWDAELQFDVFSNGAKFRNVNEVLGYFRSQPLSITSGKDYLRKLDLEQAKILSRYFPDVLVRIRKPLSIAPRILKKFSTIVKMIARKPVFPGSVQLP
jgi:glycosyltransferase involved in cell wall biosynthesis